MSVEVHDGHPDNLQKIVLQAKDERKDPAVEQEKPTFKEQMDVFETAWHAKARELLDVIPEWVPIVRPFLESKLLLEREAAAALMEGKDIQTGTDIEGWEQRLKRFAELEIRALLLQGEALIDTLLLFGTGGVGNVAEAGVKGAAKMAAKEGGLKALKELAKQLSNPEGGELEFMAIIQKAIENVAPFVEDEKAQTGVKEVARLFSILNEHEDTREGMEEFLKGNAAWQKVKEELKVAVNDPAKMTELLTRIGNILPKEVKAAQQVEAVA